MAIAPVRTIEANEVLIPVRIAESKGVFENDISEYVTTGTIINPPPKPKRPAAIPVKIPVKIKIINSITITS